MLDDVAVALSRRFIARRDVKAVQFRDGAYRPKREPFTVGDLRRHLRGEATFGHYLVNAEGQAKLFAYDIDLDPGGPREAFAAADAEREGLQRSLQTVAFGLAYRTRRLLAAAGAEVPICVSYSGAKGCHVYAFTGLMPAREAREMATELLRDGTYQSVRGDVFWKNPAYPTMTIEVFPKQDAVEEGGFGNLMRLPLGVHRKTGNETFFLSPTARWEPDDPLLALTEGSTRCWAEPAWDLQQ